MNGVVLLAGGLLLVAVKFFYARTFGKVIVVALCSNI